MRIGLGIGLNRFRGGQGGAAVVGLLDSYKGSAFAMAPDTLLYSTYSATDDISGSVTNSDTGQFSVAILRDSDNAVRSFTPAEVADGTANTWVQAGVGGAANGFVRRGYDQSVTALDVSNLNHADQDSTPAMPKLFDSSTGLILENGKAALDFDGVNDSLVTSYSVSQPITGISVFSTRVTSSSAMAVFGGSNGNSRISHIRSGTNFGSYFGALNLISSTGIDTNQHLHFVVINGTNSSYFYDGVNTDNGNAGSLDLINLSIGVGAITSYDGLGQFFAVYPANQSTNRNAIETAINNEYNIY
jgi:hypothetical protein